MSLWSDINSKYGLDGNSFVVYDDSDIETAIYNILICPIGSRAWWPTFGSRLPQLLWEPINSKNAAAVRVATIQAVTQWEPRIALVNSLTSVVVNTNNTGYDVSLGYTIKTAGTVGSIGSATFKFVK